MTVMEYGRIKGDKKVCMDYAAKKLKKVAVWFFQTAILLR